MKPTTLHLGQERLPFVLRVENLCWICGRDHQNSDVLVCAACGHVGCIADLASDSVGEQSKHMRRDAPRILCGPFVTVEGGGLVQMLMDRARIRAYSRR